MILTIIIAAIPFASAATVLDETKKVSFTVNCSKPGYTFEVFRVADLKTTSGSTNETSYSPLFDSISSEVKAGNSKNILAKLDSLSPINTAMPAGAVSCGTFTSTTSTNTKTFSNLAQGIYYVKCTKYPAGVKSATNSVFALPYYQNNTWVYTLSAINLANKVADDTPTTQKEITNSTKSNVNYTDIDRNLVNLFRCMKVRTMALIQELGICNLNSREEFETLKKFFKDEELKDKYLEEEIELTRKMMPPEYAEQLIELRLSIAHDYDVRRAAMYLKLLRYSYASSGKSFASQPFDIRKLFPLIQQAGRRLSDVVIENQDFETLIRHYDREDTFFYLDPPYYFTEGMYEGFGEEDHLRLFEVLSTIKGFCLVSYNDCFETRDIYKDYNIFAFSRPHSMAQRYEAGKEFKELLIANYDLFERVKNQPQQLTLFDDAGKMDYFNKILKESKI